jgi:SAM-dependent methyltransferase
MAGRRSAVPDPFDAAFGVDTAGVVHLADLDIPSRSWEHGVRYQPIDPAWFRRMLSQIEIAHEDYAFVDIGSGKGRAVLLATSYPFKRVIGVELSPELHRIAQRNLLAYAKGEIRCREIELVCQDAAQYALPREPTVLYLYNPFGREVMAPLVERVERSLREHPRDLVIVYVTPLLDDLWARASGLRTAGAGPDHRIYRAARA